ncbi:MAG: hypothetical protein HZA23_00975 [Nitrospirae bacterium]|nr:hypothetical protein [Nitrospirota bacterium]
MRNRIVVHLRGGLLKKGYTLDFRPDKLVFHLHREGETTSAVPGEMIDVDQAKAVFFVKSLEGNKEPLPPRPRQSEAGTRMEIRFYDGETLRGFVPTIQKDHTGFFFIPEDLASNNERIFVIRRSLSAMRRV